MSAIILSTGAFRKTPVTVVGVPQFGDRVVQLLIVHFTFDTPALLRQQPGPCFVWQMVCCTMVVVAYFGPFSRLKSHTGELLLILEIGNLPRVIRCLLVKDNEACWFILFLHLADVVL